MPSHNAAPPRLHALTTVCTVRLAGNHLNALLSNLSVTQEKDKLEILLLSSRGSVRQSGV